MAKWADVEYHRVVHHLFSGVVPSVGKEKENLLKKNGCEHTQLAKVIFLFLHGSRWRKGYNAKTSRHR